MSDRIKSITWSVSLIVKWPGDRVLQEKLKLDNLHNLHGNTWPRVKAIRFSSFSTFFFHVIALQHISASNSTDFLCTALGCPPSRTMLLDSVISAMISNWPRTSFFEADFFWLLVLMFFTHYVQRTTLERFWIWNCGRSVRATCQKYAISYS